MTLSEDVPCRRAHPDGKKGRLTRGEDGTITPTYPCTDMCAGLVEGLSLPEEPPEPDYAEKVEREVERIKVREEAMERVKAEKVAAEEVTLDVALLGEVLDRPATPRDRIDGLVPWEASTLLVAQRKVGKTTTVLNMARSLLTGEPFLDAFEVQRLSGTVAILNYEVTSATLARWADEAGVPLTGLVTVNLRGTGNPLAVGSKSRRTLAQQLRQLRVETLIVDPFGRAFTGRDQNSASEVNPWLQNLDQFAREEVGARDLMLVAHAGWSEDRARGSSALEDWPDSIITITRKNGHRYLGAMGRDVDVAETRLSFDPVKRRLALAEGTPDADSHDIELQRAVPVLVAWVQEHPGSSKASAEGKTGPGLGRNLTREALEQALDKGLIKVVEEGQKKALYATSPDLAAPRHGEVPPTSPPRPTVGRGEVESGVAGSTSPPGGGEVEDDDDGALVIDLSAWAGGGAG